MSEKSGKRFKIVNKVWLVSIWRDSFWRQHNLTFWSKIMNCSWTARQKHCEFLWNFWSKFSLEIFFTSSAAALADCCLGGVGTGKSARVENWVAVCRTNAARNWERERLLQRQDYGQTRPSAQPPPRGDFTSEGINKPEGALVYWWDLTAGEFKKRAENSARCQKSRLAPFGNIWYDYFTKLSYLGPSRTCRDTR